MTEGIKISHVISGTILAISGVALIVRAHEIKKPSLNYLGGVVIYAGVLSIVWSKK